MTGVPVLVRLTVIEREARACAACGAPCEGRVHSVHHRRTRAMGGTRRVDSNQPQNLLLLCGDGVKGCHGAVTTHPAWALSKGYRVGQTRDPATIPVWVHNTGWVYLTPEGGYLLAKDPHPDETRVLDLVADVLRGGDAA